MVNTIDLYDRVDLRDNPVTDGEGSKGRHPLRRGDPGDVFHAYASSFAQKAVTGNDPEHK